MTLPNIEDVPCGSCVAGYSSQHVCDAPAYCPCDRPEAHTNDPIHDPVNHPRHYTSHPSGVECIDVVEHMGFNLGNAVKYVWRADLKHDALEDLKKARWYIEREIAKRENTPESTP